MTPQELHAALDARRRELGLMWWQVEIKIETTAAIVREMRNGTVSGPLRKRAEAWLEQRKQASPRTE